MKHCICFLAVIAVSCLGLPPTPHSDSFVAGAKRSDVTTADIHRMSNRRRHQIPVKKPTEHDEDHSRNDDEDGDEDFEEALTSGLLSLKKKAEDGITDRKFVDKGAILFERVEEMKEHQETKERETFFCWKVFWLWVKGLAIILAAGAVAAVANFMLNHMNTQTRVQPVDDKMVPVAAPPCTIRC